MSAELWYYFSRILSNSQLEQQCFYILMILHYIMFNANAYWYHRCWDLLSYPYLTLVVVIYWLSTILNVVHYYTIITMPTSASNTCTIYTCIFVFAKRHNLHAAAQVSNMKPLFVSHSFTDVQKAHSSFAFLHLPRTSSYSDLLNTSSSK